MDWHRQLTMAAWRLLFLIIQRAHMPIIIRARSRLGHNSDIRSAAQVSSFKLGIFTPVANLTCAQKCLGTVHSRSTCLIDSSGTPQTSQLATGSMCLLKRICLDGRKSCKARHQNTQTLGGTSNFQTFFQIGSTDALGN